MSKVGRLTMSQCIARIAVMANEDSDGNVNGGLLRVELGVEIDRKKFKERLKSHASERDCVARFPDTTGRPLKCPACCKGKKPKVPRYITATCDTTYRRDIDLRAPRKCRKKQSHHDCAVTAAIVLNVARGFIIFGILVFFTTKRDQTWKMKDRMVAVMFHVLLYQKRLVTE